MYYPTAERTLDVLQVLLDSDIDHPVNAGQILKRTNINGAYKKGGRKGIYASILLIMMFFKNIFRAKHMKDGWYCEHPYTTAEPPGKYIEGDPYREILRMREEMVDHFDGGEVMLELDIYYSPETMEIVHDLAGKRVTVPRYDKQSNISHAFFRVRRGATLTGWLSQNHKFVKATAPQSVIDDVRDALAKLADSYGVN